MDLFEVIYDPKKDKGIYALSVVNDPAMEGMFITLNKDEKPEVELALAEADKEQRILLGVAAVPDKPIYRNLEGREFNVFFSKDTIKEAAHDFLRNHSNNNSSIEHHGTLEGVSVVESWIVTDTKNDKSNQHGLDAVEGSWVVAMKVENDELWNDYVKTGKVRGFSLDGLFSLNKIELNTQSMNENKTMLAELKQGFADLKALFKGESKEESEEATIELAQATLKDGETVVGFEGESIEVGTALFVVSEEGNTPAPDGEHELEDGRKVTVAEGVVTAIEEEIAEEEAGEATEEFSADDKAMLAEIKKAMEVLEAEFTTVKEAHKADVEAKDAKITELEAQLSATPSTKPKKHTSVQLSNTQSTLKEAIKNSRK